MAKSNRSGVWQRTMVIVGFVLVLGFGAVITNLVRLQLVNGETLKTDAVDQSLQSTQLTPSRGTIYDATGTKVLAQSASDVFRCGVAAERQRGDGRLGAELHQ